MELWWTVKYLLNLNNAGRYLNLALSTADWIEGVEVRKERSKLSDPVGPFLSGCSVLGVLTWCWGTSGLRTVLVSFPVD